MSRRKVAAVAAAVAAGLLLAGAAAPANAAPGWAVHFVAHTDFAAGSAEFTSSIPGCETGDVAEVGRGAHFTPRGGHYAGLKEFTCEGGESGFTVRLNANFGEGGASGTWTLVSGWGDLEGVKGSGSLVGIPFAVGEGIDDHYSGSIR